MLLRLPRMECFGLEARTKNGSASAGRGAEAVKEAITATITTLPEHLRRSLTWDRGTELAQHAQLRIESGLQVYFADPHSPWQRGTDENTNGLLRLTAEPLPDFGGSQAGEGGANRRETSWKYILRTHTRRAHHGDVVAEPFAGELPFVVTGVGPWDPAPENDFDPDRLAARLLTFVSDWRNPDEPLNADQRERFRWLGPGVKALLPSDEASAEWLRSRRPSDQ